MYGGKGCERFRWLGWGFGERPPEKGRELGRTSSTRVEASPAHVFRSGPKAFRLRWGKELVQHIHGLGLPPVGVVAINHA